MIYHCPITDCNAAKSGACSYVPHKLPCGHSLFRAEWKRRKDWVVCDLATECPAPECCPNSEPHEPDMDCESELCNRYVVKDRRQRAECKRVLDYE